ncbi:hypothetical protein [Paraflavitalea speifideaquila]|uniref:hypothetical protein n=1 Tax=Paraflavitalea speifideaquila TaxID=3076558 RepID=UPI0028EBB8E5|nr:hypothetical protein [Paraflavitalea speifideiaquila]
MHLANFLCPFIRDNNPEVVVIGGNISKSADWFLAQVETALEAQSINIPVRIARLGENAHIVGAAGCWIEQP